MLQSVIEQRSTDKCAAVVTDNHTARWCDLAEQVEQIVAQYQRVAGRRIGLCLTGTAGGLATLAALERLCCDTFLIAGDVAHREMIQLAGRFQLGAVFAANSDQDDCRPQLHEFGREAQGVGVATVTILTSGSTGQPKAARHTCTSLARPIRVAQHGERPCWLLAYRPHLYAGLQVILQCLLNSGTLAIPQPPPNAQRVAELAAAAGVQYASATPSYWRWLMTFANTDTLRQVRLMQITLGGEAVSQQILDSLAERFPSARIVHIYATTELGRCFSVTDGRAGFPARLLDSPSADGVEMRIRDGELIVRSANSMQGYDDCAVDRTFDDGGWFSTGDLVELVGDRVQFVGRKCDVINVGGNKVHPLEVERVIRSVQGVTDVRVFAKASSVAGQLVACEVVAQEGCDPAAVHEAVNAHCLKQLATHQRPRLITMVDGIRLSEAGKAIRGLRNDR